MSGIMTSRGRNGFSLIELLLAVFILGIGVIAIAALFPAGIAQQRQSVDDTIGPVVANNALAVLRSKLRAEDFGFFVDGSGNPDFDLLFPTVRGDWTWRRPGFYTTLTPLPGGGRAPAGSISIFSTPTVQVPPEDIPWSTFHYGTTPPDPPIIMTQGERYYPMRSQLSTDPFPPRPQYVWDCMFRRFQGKVLVAIFVYRVNIPGGGSVTYAVAPNPTSPSVPPLPINIDLADSTGGLPWQGNRWNVYGADINDPADDALIAGTYPGQTYNPSDAGQSWQAPGQWLLDQNNNVHRVLSGRRNASDGPVELVRPVSSMANLRVYFLDQTVTDPTTENVITNIWYIPPVDANGLTLSPVYATVREL